jgi:hypothetical protein
MPKINQMNERVSTTMGKEEIGDGLYHYHVGTNKMNGWFKIKYVLIVLAILGVAALATTAVVVAPIYKTARYFDEYIKDHPELENASFDPNNMNRKMSSEISVHMDEKSMNEELHDGIGGTRNLQITCNRGITCSGYGYSGGATRQCSSCLYRRGCNLSRCGGRVLAYSGSTVSSSYLVWCACGRV